MSNQIDPGKVIDRLTKKLAEAMLQITLLEEANESLQNENKDDTVYEGPVPEVRPENEDAE